MIRITDVLAGLAALTAFATITAASMGGLADETNNPGGDPAYVTTCTMPCTGQLNCASNKKACCNRRARTCSCQTTTDCDDSNKAWL